MHKYSYWSQNWLILKLNNEAVKENLSRIHGVVYDFGCGVRPYEKDILTVAEQYIGVDWSSTMHGLHADVIADLSKPLPIDDEVADVVVSFQVLEHLCEPQTMLMEAHRILKPTGILFLTVPWQWWIHEAPYDFFRYTPYGLMHLLKKAGFVEIMVEPQAGFFTMWLLKFNYFSMRAIRGPWPLRGIIKSLLLPVWYLNQKVAPYLDKLDKNWVLEAPGYVLTARKP